MRNPTVRGLERHHDFEGPADADASFGCASLPRRARGAQRMTTGFEEVLGAPDVDGPVETLVEPASDGDEPPLPLASLLVHPVGGVEVGESARVTSAPDIVGLEVLDAHAVVRRAGLRLAVSVWETKVGPWGMILSQQPDAGDPLVPGRRIHAVVAGRPHLVVPDVRGLDARAAGETLRRLGLQPVVAETRPSRTVGPGQVIATRPAAGSLVVDGSRVMVTVARQDRAAVGELRRPGS